MSSLVAILALFSYVNVPFTEIRKDPRIDSEVVSQAYYSEEVRRLEEATEWVKIETTVDGYQGWVQKTTLHERQDRFLSDPTLIEARVNRCAAHLYKFQDTVYGPMMTLPFDSRLEVLEPREESESRWLKVSTVDGRQAYIQRGDISLSFPLLDCKQICELSHKFLGLPYTWGGRSSFGYDCSGFVQMLYRQMGLYLPRDSKDQMQWEGFKAISLSELQPGDLIFFGLAEDKIRHVGLYLGEDRFIHATIAENAPYIHISNLTEPEWNGSGRYVYVTGRTLK